MERHKKQSTNQHYNIRKFVSSTDEMYFASSAQLYGGQFEFNEAEERDK